MKSLQDYFKQAIDREQAFTERRLRELVDRSNTDTQRSVGPRRMHRYHFHKLGIIMTIVSTTALIVGLGMAFTNERTDAPLEARAVERQRNQPAVATPATDPSVDRPTSGARGHIDPVRTRGNTRGERHVQGAAKKEGEMTDVAGINPIVLDKSELARLGITVTPHAINIRWHVEGAINAQCCGWSIFRSEIPAGPEDADDYIDKCDVPPLMITSERGHFDGGNIVRNAAIDSAIAAARARADSAHDGSGRGMNYIDLWYMYMQKLGKAGKLIPIKVSQSGSLGAEHTDEDPVHIIWYEPKPELLALLPERVRQQLTAELAAVDMMIEREQRRAENPDALVREATDIVVGERPYLDILRSASGAIVGTSILPNPTAGSAVLNFSLAQPRKISISLHDLMGRRLRDVVSDLSRQGGTYEVSVDAGDMASGIYLVVVSTDKGERAVQRLIVRK